MDISCSTAVNSIGLVLDIIGGVLLWKYGLPELVDREGRDFIVTRNVEQDQVAKARKFDRLARFGLGALIAGFILQLLSNFIPN